MWRVCDEAWGCCWVSVLHVLHVLGPNGLKSWVCRINPASVVSEAAGGSGALGLHQQQSGLKSGSVQPQRPGRLPLQVPAGVEAACEGRWWQIWFWFFCLSLSCLSFQRKVEMFHEGMQSGMFGDNEDGYVSKTIALVNCCPPLRYRHTDTLRLLLKYGWFSD